VAKKQASSANPVTSLSDIEKQAIEITRKEKTAWQNSVSFITEKVAFNMPNLIRQCRKNYWGVFDEQYDPVSGRQKIWIPLTESQVDAVVKNIDLDTKDINFRAKHAGAIGMTTVIRNAVKNELDEMGFGQELDDLERRCAIDGTAVWKTTEVKDEDGDHCVKVSQVDLLNIYIDPTTPSIKEAYRFTERSLMTVEEIQGMTGWINTKEMVGSSNLSRTDSYIDMSASVPASTSKYVDVYEMWGQIPKYLITGNEDDKSIDVEGHVIVSGLETAGKERCHLIETNNGERPYEECWYIRVPGRWYGRGIAEKLLMLQLWLNTIVNIRINRSYVNQLGIFKIKKGAGITPQMLGKLASNGAIPVNTMDDIQQMVVQEASQASYNDEKGIMDWSQRVTSAFNVVVGDALPASTSATATSLQSQGAQSAFALIKEGIGFFLQRWVKEQAIPIIMKNLTLGKILRITGEPEELMQFDEDIVNKQLAEEIDAATAAKKRITPEAAMARRESLLGKLQTQGRDRYVKLLHEVDPTDYDVQVYITNEEMDKGVMSQNLIQALQLAGPEYKDAILRQIYDVMGLDFISLKKTQLPPPETPNKISSSVNFTDLAPEDQAALMQKIGLPAPQQQTGPQQNQPSALEGLMKPPTQNPQRVMTAANTKQR